MSTPEKRLQSLATSLADEFVGRDEEALLMVACASADIPILLMGPPGTAKSEMARRFFKYLGLRRTAESRDRRRAEGANGRAPTWFEYLLTRFTLPDELFGSVDLKRMEDEGVFVRKTEGTLLEARGAFLDEIFRGSSAILNTLLAVINERMYHEGGISRELDLRVLVAAANNAPEEYEDVHALFDRFPVRLHCDPVSDEEGVLEELLRKGEGLEDLRAKDAVEPKASLRDIQEIERRARKNARTQAQAKSGSADLRHRFLALCRAARREDMVSDRTIVRLWDLVHVLLALDPQHHEVTALKRVFSHLGRTREESHQFAGYVISEVSG